MFQTEPVEIAGWFKKKKKKLKKLVRAAYKPVKWGGRAYKKNKKVVLGTVAVLTAAAIPGVGPAVMGGLKSALAGGGKILLKGGKIIKGAATGVKSILAKGFSAPVMAQMQKNAALAGTKAREDLYAQGVEDENLLAEAEIKGYKGEMAKQTTNVLAELTNLEETKGIETAMTVVDALTKPARLAAAAPIATAAPVIEAITEPAAITERAAITEPAARRFDMKTLLIPGGIIAALLVITQMGKKEK